MWFVRSFLHCFVRAFLHFSTGTMRGYVRIIRRRYERSTCDTRFPNKRCDGGALGVSGYCGSYWQLLAPATAQHHRRFPGRTDTYANTNVMLVIIICKLNAHGTRVCVYVCVCMFVYMFVTMCLCMWGT